MNILSEAIGWLGVVFGILVSLPQIVKSIKSKSTEGVSLSTYQLLFCMVLCYLVRSVVIKDSIFIVSNVSTLLVTASMLYLFKLYPEVSNDES